MAKMISQQIQARIKAVLAPLVAKAQADLKSEVAKIGARTVGKVKLDKKNFARYKETANKVLSAGEKKALAKLSGKVKQLKGKK